LGWSNVRGADIKKEGWGMASDELKIVLEDVKEKFDTVIEAFDMVRGTLERHKEENQKEHAELRNEIILLRNDLNDHEDNTELHAREKRRMASLK
jgi:hypothetical protein